MINLPSKTKGGKPYISYSQMNLWLDKKSFNLSVDGKLEYAAKYFMGVGFADKGWGQFGKEVEGYICEREFADNFTDKEKKVLDEIETLGVFQQEIEIDFGEFVMFGYVDDMKKDMSKIIDYKTASKRSGEKYKREDYWQMDVYALWVLQETGVIPEMEVCIIERKGNCMFKGGREVLKVGSNVWRIPRETSTARLNQLSNQIKEVAQQISNHYTVYQKLIS